MTKRRKPTASLARQVSKKTCNVAGRLLDLGRPVVMGILNITPDSFYQGSRFGTDLDVVVQKAGQMMEEGAVIIDVGGYSTRPDAAEVEEHEERDRVLPVIEVLRQEYPQVFISIDTFRAGVARQAIEAGAGIVNDVSGGNLDAAMFETVADLGVPYVLMHMRGTPQTMNKLTQYDNLVADIVHELSLKLARLRSLGVADVIVDPGFGFAKTVAQNFDLLNNLTKLSILDAPLLVGLSRKSLIWRSLGVTAEEALNGTTVLNTLALHGGARILRVHDVEAAVQTVKLWELSTQRN